MIPDEAVEAAAKAVARFVTADEGAISNDYDESVARRALEAAAPHLTPTPAEQAMADIEAHLERWFNGEQTQTAAMAAVSRISGAYRMEAGK